MEAWISMILGAQLQAGTTVTVMGDPDLRLPFVGIANVADLALAVLGSEEAINSVLPLSAQAVSYRQIISWIERATERSIAIESVPPGTEIPGFPPTVLELWSWLATGAIEPIETVGAAMRYGLTLELPQAFVARVFGTSSLI
jgi:nucleoside-diphosphate-sugar epimerase